MTENLTLWCIFCFHILDPIFFHMIQLISILIMFSLISISMVLIWCFMCPKILLHVHGKILRSYPHVTANFIIVDSNRRLPYSCIKNTTVKSVQGCVGECILHVNCTTFNLHKEKGICELLNISKFDSVDLVRWSPGWTHYETDDDAKLVRLHFLFISFKNHSLLSCFD